MRHYNIFYYSFSAAIVSRYRTFIHRSTQHEKA